MKYLKKKDVKGPETFVPIGKRFRLNTLGNGHTVGYWRDRHGLIVEAIGLNSRTTGFVDFRFVERDFSTFNLGPNQMSYLEEIE